MRRFRYISLTSLICGILLSSALYVGDALLGYVMGIISSMVISVAMYMWQLKGE